jgi:hypothetical protein
METKVKLVKLESKDRVYLLKDDKSPLSYFLASRDTPRRRLLYFDEETNTNHPLRYARNSNTPFQEDQDKNVILEPVVFEDGVLRVPKTNPGLQLFMHYHPGNGSEFYEFDNEKNAQEDVEMINFEIDALMMARELDLTSLEAIARLVLSRDVSKMKSSEIKRDMLLYAKKYPVEFIEAAEDPLLKINNLAARAISDGYFTFRAGKDIHYNFKENKKKLLTVPFGEDHIHVFASYLQSKEGMELYKYLQEQMEEN